MPAWLSIPLWCDWDWNAVPVIWCGWMTFNPTVVRLGQWWEHLPPGVPQDFQSHCGAIGTPHAPAWDYLPPAPPFNPTVVRLGHVAGRVAPPAVCLFQSHCGAIGTLPARHLRRQLQRLSIPLWCDWDGAAGHRRGTGDSLSIPLWCDWDLEDGRVRLAL